MFTICHTTFKIALACVTTLACGYAFAVSSVHASASLFFSPSTAIYPIGEAFTVDVRVDSVGTEVGTVDLTVAYDANDLSFVSFSSEGSIFSRIMVDDTRTPGRLDVSGFIERGKTAYRGADGLVARLTFMPLRNIATQVRFAQASATQPLTLTASVGELTNMLTALSSATYTLVPRESVPASQIATAIAYAQTPTEVTLEPAPVNEWIATSTVKASWSLPKDASSMRTLVSTTSDAQPSKVYAVPVSSVTLENLTDGNQFFLLQFSFGDTWGEVVRTSLPIDTTPPNKVEITQKEPDGEDKRLSFFIEATDELSPVVRYEIAIDGEDPIEWKRPSDGIYYPEALSAGERVLTVTAYDTAGNKATADHVVDVQSIESPVLTSIPDRVLTGDAIPVRGTTYPDAKVTVFTSYNDGEPSERIVPSDSSGEFSATITEAARPGKYTVWFSVVDGYGAKSPPSLKRSVEASQPLIMLFGKRAVTYLSIIVPLIALILILGLALWLGYAYLRSYRTHVRVETNEAYEVVRHEFEDLRKELVTQIGVLEQANQSRELTREEMRIFTELSKRLDRIEEHVQEEIDDISRVDTVQKDAPVVTHDTLSRHANILQQKENRTGTVIPPRNKKNVVGTPARRLGKPIAIAKG